MTRQLLSIFILLVGSGSFVVNSWAQQPPIFRFDDCAHEKQPKCDGPCTDGWGETIYYDRRKQQLSSVQDDREDSFGWRRESSCEPCGITYQLKTEKGIVKLSCEDFYRSLQMLNQECDGCMQVTSHGGA